MMSTNIKPWLILSSTPPSIDPRLLSSTSDSPFASIALRAAFFGQSLIICGPSQWKHFIGPLFLLSQGFLPSPFLVGLSLSPPLLPFNLGLEELELSFLPPNSASDSATDIALVSS
ncbi:hypothetical protein V6Z11_D06G214500 [Gossypium hirsutum]